MSIEKNRGNFSSWDLGNLIAIIILAAIVILGGSLLGGYVSQKQTQEVAGEVTFQPVVEKVISYEGEEGKTALDLLKASHEIGTQDSSIGVFITSIDGVKNEDNKYWMFYTEDQLAPIAADQYETKAGEKIEWRFERLQ